MDVSLIIVNLNSRQLLQDCLTSVYQHTQGLAFEVIVVDNGSDDGSAAMVKAQFPQVRLIENATNHRYSIANNQGLDIARGRYILYLNGDTVLLGNTVQEMAAFLDQRPAVGGVGCRMIYPDGAYQDACFRFVSAVNVFYRLCLARFYWRTRLAGNYPHLQNATTAQPVDFVVGAGFMARRDLLQQVHGMDPEYYFYGEDADLCYRIWQAGWPIYHLPRSTAVVHYGGVSSTINLFDNDQRQKHLRGWQSRFLFIKKQYPRWRQFTILTAVLAAFGVNAVLYGLAALKRRDWQYARINLTAHRAITRTAFWMLT